MEFFDQFREVNLLIPTPYRCNALDWPQSVVYYDHSIIHTELATQTYVLPLITKIYKFKFHYL